MAKKKIELDWGIFDGLCNAQCTQEEISNILGISISTLVRRVKEEKGETYEGYYKKASAGGKASLRRKQFERAEGGSDTMLIWLGKQYLGQADKQETDITIDYAELLRLASSDMD